MISIGIDPGQKTGWAVYSCEHDMLMELDTTDFWGVFQKMTNIPLDLVHEITVEVPDSKTVWHGKGANQKTASRVGVNVGGVIREAELMAAGLEAMGYNVRRVHPRGKVPKAKFDKLTGWSARSNEHNRDAALLCYKRKP